MILNDYSGYDSVAHAFRCNIELSENPSNTAEIELEIVTKNEKYGLLQVSYLPFDNEIHYTKEEVVPCVYDNLYYQPMIGGDCLFAVQSGKHGVLSIQAIETPFGYVLSVKVLVPCKYNRIEYHFDCPAMLHLFHTGKESFYNLIHNETSTAYDVIQTLHPNILECWSGEHKEIVDLNESLVSK